MERWPARPLSRPRQEVIEQPNRHGSTFKNKAPLFRGGFVKQLDQLRDGRIGKCRVIPDEEGSSDAFEPRCRCGILGMESATR
jgi:hypothetical protein